MSDLEQMSKPRREEHTVRLTSYQTDIAQKLARKQNRAFADVLSTAVEIGLDVLIERDTRVNIWNKTSSKSELIDLIENIPSSKMEQAIALLKELGESQK